ncbi:MAG TPA: tRNA (adenosine(37)-N6)-dimethylallyltransferase MiaA [Ideonella sp.]|uniref:tRNA (adenosine(37)-N6)-dimethylallyltransferase MiaA n=1 Tax=Ideonella sp. TaxID=1929293 RepID=UPI002E33FC69|nr:tRNA (adenosine(37)-N6)-dimethylallyltransferase MiaA [Ideonella sp.]HEX5684964.1 tRNA (adenosine(37)-N6)-dimethylallyltransferase MiaA [Ideonella sp.]
MQNTIDWIGVAGPTASGKTGLALKLATELPLEIVSVDSALVYRGMDIGTAKPTAAELATVPHHLVDILDPSDSYSAARFAIDAQRLIADIRARDKLPLLVGGTMLYFKALIDGIDELPPADATVRTALDAEAAARGWPALHAELVRVDPVTAARLAPNDAQRIQRALEVFRVTGQPLSAFHTRGSDAPITPPRHRLLALEPRDRAWLHARIGQRFEQMLTHGFLDEVRALRERGDLHTNLPSMRCVGYRQAWEALDAGLSGDALRTDLLERGSAATRQLAKRQLTWLRGMDRVSVEAEDDKAAEQALWRLAAEAGFLTK